MEKTPIQKSISRLESGLATLKTNPDIGYNRGMIASTELSIMVLKEELEKEKESSVVNQNLLKEVERLKMRDLAGKERLRYLEGHQRDLVKENTKLKEQLTEANKKVERLERLLEEERNSNEIFEKENERLIQLLN